MSLVHQNGNENLVLSNFRILKQRKKTDGRGQFTIVGRAIILWEAIQRRIHKPMLKNQTEPKKRIKVVHKNVSQGCNCVFIMLAIIELFINIGS